MDDPKVQWLFVINAQSASVADDRLTLEGLHPTGIAFTDRPERQVQRFSAERFLARWNETFGQDPPNAAVSWVGGDGEMTAAVELGTPRLDGDDVVLPFLSLPSESDAPGLAAGATAPLSGQLDNVSVFVDSGGIVSMNAVGY